MNHVINSQANVKYSSPSADAAADDPRHPMAARYFDGLCYTASINAVRAYHWKRDVRTAYGARLSIDNFFAWADGLQRDGYNVHAQVNLDNGQKNSKFIRDQDITKGRALFADIDKGDARAIMAEIERCTGIKSSMVVWTSPGKAQLYWLINGDIKIPELAAMQAYIASTFDVDARVRNIGRVLRIPGTLNVKKDYAPNYPMVMLDDDLSTFNRYTIAQLRKAFPVTAEDIEASAKELAGVKAKRSSSKINGKPKAGKIGRPAKEQEDTVIRFEDSWGEHGGTGTADEIVKGVEAIIEACAKLGTTGFTFRGKGGAEVDFDVADRYTWFCLQCALKDHAGDQDGHTLAHYAIDRLNRLEGAPEALQDAVRKHYAFTENVLTYRDDVLMPEDFVSATMGERAPITVSTFRAIVAQARKIIGVTREMHDEMHAVLATVTAENLDITRIHDLALTRLNSKTREDSQINAVGKFYLDHMLNTGGSRIKANKQFCEEAIAACGVKDRDALSDIHKTLKKRGFLTSIPGYRSQDGTPFFSWPADIVRRVWTEKSVAEWAAGALRGQQPSAQGPGPAAQAHQEHSGFNEFSASVRSVTDTKAGGEEEKGEFESATPVGVEELAPTGAGQLLSADGKLDASAFAEFIADTPKNWKQIHHAMDVAAMKEMVASHLSTPAEYLEAIYLNSRTTDETIHEILHEEVFRLTSAQYPQGKASDSEWEPTDEEFAKWMRVARQEVADGPLGRILTDIQELVATVVQDTEAWFDGDAFDLEAKVRFLRYADKLFHEMCVAEIGEDYDEIVRDADDSIGSERHLELLGLYRDALALKSAQCRLSSLDTLASDWDLTDTPHRGNAFSPASPSHYRTPAHGIVEADLPF